MTLVRLDTVQRANVASGWGTATDGNIWTSLGGDGQSVVSDTLEVTNSSLSTFAVLGSDIGTLDANVLAKLNNGGSSNPAGALARCIDINNYYLARYNGAGAIEAFKNIAGTKTVIGSFAFSAGAALTFWLRFLVQGTALSIKAWQDGTTEPASYNYTTTDTGLSGAGGNRCGLYGFANSPGTVSFFSFSVDDTRATPGGSSVPMVPHHRFAYLT